MHHPSCKYITVWLFIYSLNEIAEPDHIYVSISYVHIYSFYLEFLLLLSYVCMQGLQLANREIEEVYLLYMVMFMLTYVCFICLFVFYALRVIYPWLLETIFICIWWASICLTMTITLKLRRFALWWYSLDSNTWFTNKLELTPAKIQYNILLATTYYLFNTIILGFRQNDFSKFIII